MQGRILCLVIVEYVFFLVKLTNDVEYKEKKEWLVEYYCFTRVNTNGCTNERVSILGNSSPYCQMCQKNQPGNLEK